MVYLLLLIIENIEAFLFGTNFLLFFPTAIAIVASYDFFVCHH